MKIAFLCPSVSRTCGGIFEIERKLAQALARLPLTALQIFGQSDKHTLEDLPAWSPLQPKHFPYVGPSSFRYSIGLHRALRAADVDLVHLHALWMYNSVVLRQWAQRWKRPYLITANGMLEPWAVRNSGWKKRVALSLYERGCLHGAACIQVNSQAEYESVRAFGIRKPVCIIPNGIDLPEETERQLPSNSLISPGKKTLFYLGRLHPKKGLVNLLKAWAQIKDAKQLPSDWVLAIAGWDQAGHQNELLKLASELRLLSSVVFPGPRFGAEKSAYYRNCDGFILPSFSEGLPMAVLEAWSYGKPVLMTPGCNLPEGFSAAAAMRIDPAVDNIAVGLKKLFEMSDHQRQAMGQHGLNLVKTRFTWPKVAVEMRSVYAWMLGAGPKPDCVKT